MNPIHFFLNVAYTAETCEELRPERVYIPEFSKLFKIAYFKDYKIIFSGSEKYLIQTGIGLRCQTQLLVLNKNISKLVATSTTYLPAIKFIDKHDTLIGFQGTQYINTPEFDKKKIKNLSYQMRMEEVIALKPELFLTYPLSTLNSYQVKKYNKFGVAVVFNYDFKEQHPLARAEWAIFIASLFDQEAKAIDFFNEVKNNYFRIKRDLLGKLKSSKKILVGDIQNGRWAAPAQSSDLSILLSDAGGELFLENKTQGTMWISLENIFLKNSSPAIWLTHNFWKDKKVIAKDARYIRFKNVPAYNNNKKSNEFGFSDYWENGLARPDLILADLAAIIHPELFPKYETHWYKKLE